ncbi:MAG: DUF3052 family protein [Phycisphaerales bacterium JB043]
MPGYSGTPLPKKLGIKPSHRVALVGAPKGFEDELVGLPDDATLSRGLRGTKLYDVIIIFSKTEKHLTDNLDKARALLDQSGGIWCCWPKKASGVSTELSDGTVREIGLATGMVDNKTCAVTDVWSGLRFVIRLKDRR